MSKRRELAARLLLDPPCPECGAYEGQKFRFGSQRFDRFLDCDNSDCCIRYGYSPLNEHNSGAQLKKGDLVIVEGRDL